MRSLGSEQVFSWTLALLLSLFAALTALVYPIENYAVDAAIYHVYRAVIFAAGQADGYLYPRWAPVINGGLGGPLFLFYSPGVYAWMVFLNKLGIPFALTWRVVIALTFVLASAGTFSLGLAIFRRADVALASAALYTYSPYLLRELFERGSPQGIAIALYPSVLLAFWALAERPVGIWLTFASMVWAGLILIHHVGALMFLPVLILWLGFVSLKKGGRASLPMALALINGLLLSAFFLIPLAAERWAVQLEKAASAWAVPVKGSIPLSELFRWPVVFDTGRGDNGTGQTLGPFPLIAFPLAGVVVFLAKRRTGRGEKFLIGSWVCWGILTLWLQTSSATPIWAAATPLSVLQFRWRLLAPVGLITAMVIGFMLTLVPRRWIGRISAGITGLAVAIALPLLYPTLLPYYGYFGDVPLSPSLKDVMTLTLRSGHSDLSGFGELFPRWRLFPFTLDEAERIAESPISNLPDVGRIFKWERRTGFLEVELETPVAFQAAIHALYFPGWTGYLDGERQFLQPAEGSGYVLLDVPAGRHTILLRYEGTIDQRIGDWASGITAGGLLILSVFYRGSRRGKLTWKRDMPILYLSPHWWVVGLLIGLTATKIFWLDSRTPFLRYHSTCESVRGAQIQVEVWFGETVRLCGYTLSSSHVAPEEKLSVTLYWEIPHRVNSPANSFVHLLGPFNPATGNPLWGQQDKQMIIDWWWPGKLYQDTYTFQVFPDAPPGEYSLEIGWWDPETGERYPPRIVCGENIALSEWDSLLVSTIIVP